MRDDIVFLAYAQIGDDAHGKYGKPCMPGCDDLLYGAHAYGVTACDVEEPVLGTGLESGTGDTRVDAFVDLYVHRGGDRFCLFYERLVVGFAHVGETGAQLKLVLTQQRIDHKKTDMVPNDHQ